MQLTVMTTNERIAGWGGGAVVALAITGVAGFIGAVVALFATTLIAAAVFLGAAAISFAGIANVVFRK
jgi:hypothetical protein